MNTDQQPHDEVDDIVAAWSRELPEINPSPMHIFSRMGRLTRRLDLNKKYAFGTQALEPWEFDVLAALRRAGAPYALTAGELMQETLVTSGTMTNRIDKLEAAGLLTRQPSPHDRRIVLVTLTPQGQAKVDDAVRSLVTYEENALSPLNATERNTLAHLLRKLLVPIEHATTNPPPTRHLIE